MKSNLVIIVLLVFMSACNQEQETSNEQTKIEVDQSSAIASESFEQKGEGAQEQQVTSVVDFTYKDLEGNDVSLSDFRGKWVVVNFWATWCPPCRKEIPDFVKFKDLYADQVEILGINNEDADNEIIENFIFEYEINYPILRADVYNPSDFSKENTMGLPTTVIFNPKGEQVNKTIGPIHFADLVKIVDLK